MKLPVYLRQSWQIMLKDRQYSLIYITGVALSMAFVMAFLMYVLMSSSGIYPEKHRNRMLILSNVTLEDAEGKPRLSTMVSGRLAQLIEEAGIPGVESMSYIISPFRSGALSLTAPDGNVHNAPVMYVDGGFWDVFQFEFIGGQAPGEWNPARVEVVVSETFARRCFGSDDAVGQSVLYGGTTLRICGVVRDVPITAMMTDAEVWLPYQLYRTRFYSTDGQPWLGSGYLNILAESRRDFNAVRAGVSDVIARYNASYGAAEEYCISSDVKPETYLSASILGMSTGTFLSVIVLLVLLLMIVPAVNLNGMVASSMEERIVEFGVRKAYGAPGGVIVRQVLTENFLLTLIGGLFGVVCARGLLGLLSRVLEQSKAGYDTVDMQADLVFPADVFFRPELYLLVFVCVLALNLLSSYLPVRKVLRYSVSDSLNERK